jgi:hypothetical protein
MFIPSEKLQINFIAAPFTYSPVASHDERASFELATGEKEKIQ